MNDKIHNLRKNFEKFGTTAYLKAENVTIKKETIGGVDCYWFNNKESANVNKLIVYFHGGCFALGSIQSHQSLVSHLSENFSLPVLFVEYSLAPERPFPTAIDEFVTVYEYLLLKKPKQDIIFIGDSAGAGLALSVLSKLNNKDIPLPTYLVMLSPWVDLTCSNESFSINAPLDPVLTKKALQNYTSLYVNENNLSDANPIETLCGQFPPTLILVGSGEILLGDSKAIYDKIVSQQAKVKLSIYDKQNHVWMLDDIHTEASKKALREIKEFITD